MEHIEISVKLPKDVLSAAKVSRKELAGLIREYLAVELYRLGKISLGKAAEVAGVGTRWEMMRVLAKHDVWLHYTADDVEEDLESIRRVVPS